MRSNFKYAPLFTLSPLALFIACGGEVSDKLKDLVELGTDNFVTEADLGFDTPAGWDFVLAVNLEADQQVHSMILLQ